MVDIHDRGKKPSNLEIIKAQFMYNVHLHGNDDTNDIINEIKERFENIYKSISLIENDINEDDILTYTLRVYFNSLHEGNAVEKINKNLLEKEPIPFIKNFTYELADSFENLKQFFNEDNKANINIHSLITLGNFSIAIPFILKAYKFGLNTTEIGKLCLILESLVLRHRLIGTKANMILRINYIYQEFTAENNTIEGIAGLINDMKKDTSYWWGHWNNNHLEPALQGSVNHSIAKFLLWKYENHLRSKGKSGYQPMRFDEIEKPELEHIAPTTEPKEQQHGYDKYDEEFENEYLNCLGNYLLLSKPHNYSISNNIFVDKIKDYTYLAQQREIQKITENDILWNKEKIKQRKEKIINFILKNF